MKSDIRLVGSLDLGTTKISAMLGERRGDWVRVIGIGTTASDGLKQGVIVDIEKAMRSVVSAVQEAEKMAGMSLKRYNVGIAGEHVRCMNSRGVVGIPDPDREIDEEDVARALHAASNFSLPTDREILHTLPQQYIIDNQGGIREPAGMHGTRLEARAHVVTASRPALDNVVRVLDYAGLDVGDLVLEPLASNRAVVTDEEREIGVMMIDIGGGTSDVMICSEHAIIASGVIGIGGNNVTSDVAYGLRTSVNAAETLKVEHGCALSSLVPMHEKIDVPGIGFRETKQVGRQLLSAIIEPRVTELFCLINEQITGSELRDTLGAGVVLTGGSSMLEGTRELAEQVFDLPVRVGAPTNVDGLAEIVSHPMHATGVGLLLCDGVSAKRSTMRLARGAWWRHSFDQLRRAIAGFI